MTFLYQRAAGDRIDVGDGAVVLAGGTDLLSLYKVGLVDPSHVVDLKTSDLPSGIERHGEGWSIGALATLADLEDDADLCRGIPALGQAVEQVATRQLRNRATIGGTLLQEPRCRYYRDEDSTCWFGGAEECHARDGRNDHHAIFDTGPCVAVQPSDLASVLVALDAAVVVRSNHGERHVAVEDLLRPPTEEVRSLHRLPEGDLITSIEIRDRPNRRTSYLKATDRAVWAFALAGVATAIETDDEGVSTAARLVASGVAAVPWRLTTSELTLLDRPLDEAAITAAAEAACAGASPLGHNGYKRALLRGLARRALESL